MATSGFCPLSLVIGRCTQATARRDTAGAPALIRGYLLAVGWEKSFAVLAAWGIRAFTPVFAGLCAGARFCPREQPSNAPLPTLRDYLL